VKRSRSIKQSAGLLLYRHKDDGVEILLGHPGGPFWRNKDLGSWSIPKGLIVEGETPLAAAKREFAQETGHRPRAKSLPLGEARQPGARSFMCGRWKTTGSRRLQSNMFEMEWPPRSGQRQTFSELDRAEWFGIAEARAKILKGQAVFLDRLLTVIADNSTMPPAGRSAQTHRN
jgi:predicted NUDIX family NTP pyrophosphohydrolase